MFQIREEDNAPLINHLRPMPALRLYSAQSLAHPGVKQIRCPPNNIARGALLPS
jgi:hypothetical protein